MNKNLKRLLSTSLVLLSVVSFGFTPKSVFASETKNYNINTIEDLKNEVEILNSNTFQKSENDLITQNLIEETDPNVFKSYLENLNDEIQGIIDNSENIKFFVDTNNSTSSNQEFTLSDGGIVEITQSISPVQKIQSRKFYPWGDNEYKYTYKVKHTLFPDTQLCLTTIFDVGKNAIECTSSSTKGTSAIIPVTVSKSSKVYKSKAKNHGEYIGAQGDYTVTVAGYDGIGLVSLDFTVKSKIVLDYIGTSGAEVDVSAKGSY
ncbi:hypothetical protein FDB39_17320 [Clostridium botulinum]|nr:hypothetical protein [Clostridium botulinum]NFO58573.1 hypothetical protein [Clostridium botulinum]